MSQYLPLLACPLMMGLMVLLLARSDRNKDQPPAPLAEPAAGTSPEVADLKAEIEALRAELRDSDPRTPA